MNSLHDRRIGFYGGIESEHSQGPLRIFWIPPINSGTGKATDFNFLCIFTGSIGTKVREKFWDK